MTGKKDYLNNIQSLEGEVLISVEYLQVDNGSDEECEKKSAIFDELDFGLNLIMESGKIFGFEWGSEFAQYGVSIINKSNSSKKNEYYRVEAADHGRWKNLFGKSIQSTEIIWNWVNESGMFRKRYYPQSVVLNFSSDEHVIVSAIAISKDFYARASDTITVFFDKETAKSYNAL